eukprot:scaffold22084_cov117-Isochrysis_galbana.AAC.5
MEHLTAGAVQVRKVSPPPLARVRSIFVSPGAFSVTSSRAAPPRVANIRQLRSPALPPTSTLYQAGMHEVVVTAEAVGRASRAVAAGRPGWRISSTLFAHVASSRTLAPLPPFARAAAAAAYPPTQAGEQVMGVLRQIKLFTPHAQA